MRHVVDQASDWEPIMPAKDQSDASSRLALGVKTGRK
jgi:hypothetical protein